MNQLPTEVVVTTDERRLASRRKGLLIVGVVALCVSVGIWLVPVPVGLKIALSVGLPFGALVVLAWQRPYELRLARTSESPLILQGDKFRIYHQGQYSWIRWQDVADLGVREQGGLWFNKWYDLVFVLDQSAPSPNVPGWKPLMSDRLLTYGAKAVALRHTAPSPSIEELLPMVQAYWTQSKGAPAA